MIGKTISHYEILDKLGEGGMGVVYRARDTRLERDVALKFLPEHVTGREEAGARFLQEARAAAALNHPNICTIYGVEEHDRRMFIAMEFIDGGTLRKKIPLAGVHDTVAVASQIAEALQEAHAAGIVHRDIKADNIMLNSKGQARVMDFGLAKLKGSLKLTKTSSTVGTLGYMSPEQISGGEVDARSDLFSFGVLIFEMLTGHLPFRGEHEAAMVYSIMNEQPEPVVRFIPDAPPELVLLLSKALEKVPQDRYQSAAEMLVDLRRLKRSTTRLSGTYTAVSPGDARRESTGHGGDTPARPPSDTGRARQTGLILKIGIPILLLAAVALWYFTGGSTEPVFSPGDFEMTRLTSSGNADFATLSPDGRYLVYARGEPGAYSLLIKQIVTSGEVEVIPPTNIRFTGSSFSNDGNYVYYTASLPDAPYPTVYRTPVLGGSPPKKIIENVAGSVTCSPDDSKIAYFRAFSETGEEALFVADADGSNERKVSSRDGKNYFYWMEGSAPAWSPDGKIIACPAGSVVGKFTTGVVAVDVASGREINFSSKRWDGQMGRIAWLPDGRGLVACEQEGGSLMQLWYISYPGGKTLPITNDLAGYGPYSLSVTGDGSAVVTSQTTTTSTLWVMPGGKPGDAREITRGANRLDGESGVAWSGTDALVFTSFTGRQLNLHTIRADGSGETNLSTARRIHATPSVDPVTRDVYFGSRDEEIPHVHRIRRDGSRDERITEWEDYNPDVSPDGKWLVFDSWRSGTQSLWKMRIDTADTAVLLRESAVRPRISPDGRRVVCRYYDRSLWRNAILDFETGTPSLVFDLPLSADENIEWSPDGREVHFIDTRAGVSNIRSIDPATGAIRPVTEFRSGRIFRFAWSPDGKDLVVARGQRTTDIVMMKQRERQ